MDNLSFGSLGNYAIITSPNPIRIIQAPILPVHPSSYGRLERLNPKPPTEHSLSSQGHAWFLVNFCFRVLGHLACVGILRDSRPLSHGLRSEGHL